MSVDVVHRRVMFEGRYVSSLPLVVPAQYDVHPDGHRFVVLRQITEDRQIVVVLDWIDEVCARMAAAGRR